MQPIGDDSGYASVDGTAYPTISLTQADYILPLEGQNLRLFDSFGGCCCHMWRYYSRPSDGFEVGSRRKLPLGERT